MSERQAGLQITLPAEAGNVALVRHAMAGLAEAAGMRAEAVADLKTVVSEACMNVVVHAFPDGGGTITVWAVPDADSLLITVSDTGAGIQPRVDVERPDSSLRLGFSLIAALCSSFQISGGLNQGTTIAMRLPLSGAVQPAEGGEPDKALDAVPGEVRILATNPELLPTVLSRAVSAFGTRRDLSVDQISDAVLLADSISAGAPAIFGDDDVRLSLSDGDGGIDLSVGPLQAGGGANLREGLKLPDLDGSMEALADDVRVEERPGGEYLVLRIAPVA